MKKIPLTRGKFAIVDDFDYAFLVQWKWHFTGQYAARKVRKGEGPKKNGQTGIFLMHRILVCPGELQVDHRNQNKLDNRRCNLRVATLTENNRNTGKRATNTTGFKGVSFDKARRRFRASIDHGPKQIFLGRFDTAEEAYSVYVAKAKELRGAFAGV